MSFSPDHLKTLAAQAALDYLVPHTILGVGTGSTVNKFIDCLGPLRAHIQGAVSSSVATTVRLQALGIPVFDASEVDTIEVYVDGADEIDNHGFMIKGGGAALTREKIVAAQAKRFVCIADASKLVSVLGQFPLPVEVVPMATGQLQRNFAQLGGKAVLRLQPNGEALVTDNGLHILDVHGLHIDNPLAFEAQVNQWPGVLTVGVFAQHKASVCLLARADGVQTLSF